MSQRPAQDDPPPPEFAEAAGADPAQHHLGHRERLRARFRDGGPRAVADYELLELLLFRVIPRRDVKPLAKALIARFGSFAEVITAEPSRLREVKGVTEAVALDLKIVQAAALKLSAGSITDRPVISSWSALLDYCRAAMSYDRIEQFRVLFLDRKNRLIADEVMQRGTIDHTPVFPREVLRRALELSAASLILLHNHPSGDPTPSRADIEMTRQIVEAARQLNIAVHDHLVIGQGEPASFKALGLM